MIKIEMPEKMVENYKMVINELLNDPNKYEEYCGKATKRAENIVELERISTDYDNEFF